MFETYTEDRTSFICLCNPATGEVCRSCQTPDTEFPNYEESGDKAHYESTDAMDSSFGYTEI